ncbi:glycosyltransferase [Niallia endozanthoxylica]|uniref:Glycosyltransferase n=1 Tax=Niallia endozanthoxylica TaxID=2036016 RepID=A0A5J5HQZ7_9BACI|nr:glycosyltransferase [Niallia endozanthoxylica]KAA9022076.1 glycosyltransferase [Niallia endozanthoxylica]
MMKVTIVVVFYKQDIKQSKTFSSLEKVLLERKAILKNIDIILYDNSPEKQDFDVSQYSGQIDYIHDPRNLGIATAYNYAWQRAEENGSEWLLLFDHDTKVTEEYIDQMLKNHDVKEEIVAVVPKIVTNGIMVSPVYSHSLRPLQTERPVEGVQEKPVMAINSGSLLKVSFLNEIGGFNKEFPLDYLDHWLFHEIYDRDKKIRLLRVTLEHDLSVMDYSGVSLNRYKSILDAEMKYYSKYKTELSGEYRKQLVKRLAKQLLVVKNKRIALYTLSRLLQK